MCVCVYVWVVGWMGGWVMSTVKQGFEWVGAGCHAPMGCGPSLPASQSKLGFADGLRSFAEWHAFTRQVAQHMLHMQF